MAWAGDAWSPAAHPRGLLPGAGQDGRGPPSSRSGPPRWSFPCRGRGHHGRGPAPAGHHRARRRGSPPNQDRRARPRPRASTRRPSSPPSTPRARALRASWRISSRRRSRSCRRKIWDCDLEATKAYYRKKIAEAEEGPRERGAEPLRRGRASRAIPTTTYWMGYGYMSSHVAYYAALALPKELNTGYTEFMRSAACFSGCFSPAGRHCRTPATRPATTPVTTPATRPAIRPVTRPATPACCFREGRIDELPRSRALPLLAPRPARRGSARLATAEILLPRHQALAPRPRGRRGPHRAAQPRLQARGLRPRPHVVARLGRASGRMPGIESREQGRSRSWPSSRSFARPTRGGRPRPPRVSADGPTTSISRGCPSSARSR